ncbi:MAG: anti-sigma factor family protein [Sphaerochaetaceae bacterium]|jgi:hypothetical protein|nr:hypothetical protein [Sphaerochaetaceae bacterium]HHU89308.1 hypothetical protein [Spirochaetales bacterium]
MCLDDQILNTYLDGELVEPWRTQVEEHLTYCNACKSRFEQLQSLHYLVSSSRLEDQEIEDHSKKVYQFIENNYISKKKRGFFSRDFRIKTPTLLAVAAAFIVIFVGALLINPKGAAQTDQLIPRVNVAEEGRVVQVKATDGLTVAQILDNFSLEEILKYLDSRGYEVDLRLKGLIPIDSVDNLL